VPPGRESEAIARLPVAALRIDAKTALGLNEIGIIEVSHVMRLSRASLAARFDGVLLLGLRRALGEAPEHIEPVRPAVPPRRELVFDGPTDHWESVHAAAHQTLKALIADLNRQQHGVRRLDLELLRPRLSPVHIQINLSRPSRAAKHLWSLVRSRLEHVDLGEGVESVVLTASRTARLRHEQHASPDLGAGDERATDAAWGELIDTLAARFGADHAAVAEPVESHLPERAFRVRSALEAPPRAAAGATTTRADRPTALFQRPEPAEVVALTPDGPILSVDWRGGRWKVIACAGPERIGQEWWRWEPAREDTGAQDTEARPRPRPRARHPPRPAPPDRDYFAVQTDEGRWLWMFRHVGTPRWFVHGEWS
jgi:protein ImuB